MKVGTLEETLTVVGESPVVDVRGTTTQTVLTADVIATLPSSRNVFDMTKFVIGCPRARRTSAARRRTTTRRRKIHGVRGNDRGYYRDGVRIASYFGDGDAPRAYGSTGAQQEVNYETAAIPGVGCASAGSSISMVSKRRRQPASVVACFTSGTNEALQSSNLDTGAARSRRASPRAARRKRTTSIRAVGGPHRAPTSSGCSASARVLLVHVAVGEPVRPGWQSERLTSSGDSSISSRGRGSSTATTSSRCRCRTTDLRPYRRETATFVQPEAAGFNTSGRNPYNRFIVGNWMSTLRNSWLFEVGWGHDPRWRKHAYCGPKSDPNDVRAARYRAIDAVGCADARARRPDHAGMIYNVAVTRVGQWRGIHEIKCRQPGRLRRYSRSRPITLNDTILRLPRRRARFGRSRQYAGALGHQHP